MSFIELVAIGGANPSSGRTVAAGAVERVGLKTNTGSLDNTMAQMIQVQDDVSGWQDYRELIGGKGNNSSEFIPGPCTYRLVPKRGTCGSYAEF